jgi:DNA ligase 1
MRQFAQFIKQLDSSTRTNDKLYALVNYFTTTHPKDAVWIIALFTGRRPKRIVTTKQLKTWCAEYANIPYWLFDESYHTIGDLAETISLLVGSNHSNANNIKHVYEYINDFAQYYKKEETVIKEYILSQWRTLDTTEIFLFNKIITGGFRIGISDKMIVKALSQVYNIAEGQVAHALSGTWNALEISIEELLKQESGTDYSKPYPFCLAYSMDDDFLETTTLSNWCIEYKWDGIRAQIIKRNNELYIWSRGEELITPQFPELHFLKDYLPNGVVLDGELIAMKDKQVLPFQLLQQRISRKKLTRKILEEVPIGFIAYDLLEHEGKDIRDTFFIARHHVLTTLLAAQQHIIASGLLQTAHKEDVVNYRNNAKQYNAEGVMIKLAEGIYHTGRKKGNWYKWKLDPYTIDAVLLYAQKGHGRRSNLYTDFTFALKHEDKLVTFAKAYSGLTDEEFKEVTKFVNENCVEKFGPVRTVPPQLVFEIAFEGIQESKRHKSGIAVRFPRILRWRKDKLPTDINTLEDIKQLLK